MKKLKHKILIGLLLTTTLAIKAQPILDCKSSSFTTTSINSNCNSCNTLDDYIPINSDSILYVRLNFHYLMINPTTPGNTIYNC
jgi:hypothetical protein